MEKKDIKSYNLTELRSEMESISEKRFRADQIFKWLHADYAVSFDEMTNLPKELRKKLGDLYTIRGVLPVKIYESKIDKTRKYLFNIEGGSIIESVMMPYHHGNSVCISTQSGCRMGCRFCASTVNGLERNLYPSELLDQVYAIERDTKKRVSNVVLMGSGEPLDNYDNVIRFIELITDEKGKNFSARNITLSTCGIVPKILELAELKLQITLAVSLHAPQDETRRKIMPIAFKYSVKEIVEACDVYFEKTGRRVSFEYSLIRGVNDSLRDADGLSSLLAGKNCHVNLIPVNPVDERDYVQPDRTKALAFKGRLEKSGVNVTIRREMGRDIDGACGQLRNKAMNGGINSGEQ